MRTFLLLSFAVVLHSYRADAQVDKPGGGAPPPPKPEAVTTEATMELKDDRPQPKKTITELSKHHRRMNDYCGSWNEVINIWESKRAKPKVDSMMCNISMVMENHQQTTHKGMINGERFSGIGITSCDTATGVYTSIWIDNSSTTMSVLPGKWDSQANALIFSGEETDPESKGKLNIREVHSFYPENKDRFRIEVFKSTQGKEEFKTMQIDLQRVKR